MNTWRLALSMLRRDWRAGELRVLGLALLVAVASVSSVGFFADRVKQALERDATQLLGADVLISSDNPWPAEIRDEVPRRGLRLAENTSFVSMARHAGQAQLASVKAVSDNYPLRGSLRTAPALNAPDVKALAGPARGEVWVDERLATALGADTGASLELGDATLKVGAIVTLEPDRGVSFFNIAPRLMMNLADVPATGLVQTGSRVYYHLLAAGEPDAVKGFEQWVAPRIARGQQLQSLANARPEVRGGMERAQKFIGLTAMLAVILAAVAVSLSTRRYGERHMDGYAVMRCLGATQGRLLALAGIEFTVLGVVASLAGCLLGFGVQLVIAQLLAGVLGVALPAPSLLPAAQGILTGLALLLGFALPPLLQLRNVPALRVIRRDVGMPQQRAIAAWGLGVAAIGALLVWQSGDVKLGLVALGGFGAALVGFAFAAWGLLNLLGRVAGGSGLGWRYGLASLRRRSRSNAIQIVALALGLTAILLLTFTREDLLATWRSKIPADAPNRFLLNIQPEQRDPVLAQFRDAKLGAPQVYPMVRGRFMALNGVPVNAADFEDRARRLVEREFNLSYMLELPGHNQVVGGRWFAPSGTEGELSVEEGIAKTLGWKLGDALTFQAGGREFSARITSLRKLDWDSMRVNFFVIGTPALMEQAPTSFITSFHLPEGNAAFVNGLSKRFPNLTVVDMSAILRQATIVMEQVIAAVQFVFMFALGAGVLVLYSALLATQDERLRESALMRALGASRARIAGAQRAEFLALGGIAGLLASIGASAIGWAIAERVFQFPHHINPWIWVAGPALGLLCVSFNAWMGARAALSSPPLLVLREA